MHHYTYQCCNILFHYQAELALKDCIEANRLEPGNVKALFRQGQAYKVLLDSAGTMFANFGIIACWYIVDQS